MIFPSPTPGRWETVIDWNGAVPLRAALRFDWIWCILRCWNGAHVALRIFAKLLNVVRLGEKLSYKIGNNFDVLPWIKNHVGLRVNSIKKIVNRLVCVIAGSVQNT